jgi:hypothetical protein
MFAQDDSEEEEEAQKEFSSYAPPPMVPVGAKPKEANVGMP